MIKQKPLAEKVDNYVPVPECGCWLWMGCVDRDGYGRMRGLVDGVVWFMFAHRASFIVHKGNIPNRLHVLHRCDVPSCINPDHLYAGTHQQNMQDKQERNPVVISQEQRDSQSAWNYANPQPKSPSTGRFISRKTP